MGFEIVWDPKALKDLEKLPREFASRIIAKIDDAGTNPKRYAEQLVGISGYKIRAGDYRIFVGISYNPNKLKVMAIKHRREAYKKK